MTTKADLIRIVRDEYLDDVSDNPDQNEADYRWSTSFLTRALGRAETVACQSSKLIFDSTTTAVTQITLVTDTASYSYHDKITQIGAVIYDDEPLIQKTERELVDEEGEEWRTETGEPTSFIIKGRTIRFFPAPTSTENGGIVYLEVYRLPMNAFADALEIPEEQHENLCAYVAYLAYNRRDEDTYNPEKANEMKMDFESVFGRPVKASVRRHHLEQPRNTSFRSGGYCV